MLALQLFVGAGGVCCLRVSSWNRWEWTARSGLEPTLIGLSMHIVAPRGIHYVGWHLRQVGWQVSNRAVQRL